MGGQPSLPSFLRSNRLERSRERLSEGSLGRPWETCTSLALGWGGGKEHSAPSSCVGRCARPEAQARKASLDSSRIGRQPGSKKDRQTGAAKAARDRYKREPGESGTAAAAAAIQSSNKDNSVCARWRKGIQKKIEYKIQRPDAHAHTHKLIHSQRTVEVG